MDNNFYIPHSSAEDDALQGLTWAAQVMYLRGIRRYVNFSTQVAGGHEIRLSWQRFRTCLEVIRPSRSKNKSEDDRPSRQFIRERVKELEKAGLVTLRASAKNRKEYVFFLPQITMGVVRLREEQPKKTAQEQPKPKAAENSYQNGQEQPKKQPISAEEQPQFNAFYSSLSVGQPYEFKGFSCSFSYEEQPQQQPTPQPQQQPKPKTAKNSYQNGQEQPKKTGQEQPYISIEKKRIEEDASLTVEQREVLSAQLDALANDSRFRMRSLLTNDNHWQFFKDLVIRKRMTKTELTHIMSHINENQYAIQLIGHQLDFYRNRNHSNVTPIRQPERKPEQKTKPPSAGRLIELADEIQSLKRMISVAAGVDTDKLNAQLQRLIAEQESLRSA